MGSVIVDAYKENDALMESAYQINKSLAKICFAHNTEANLGDGYYIIDLTKNLNAEWVGKELIDRWSYVKEDPETSLSKMESLSPGKLKVLDLALAYYELGEYANPLRIESFFSCITVTVRNLLGINPKDNVPTSMLRDMISYILKEQIIQFDEKAFINL